jgi:hypothetical protein
MAHGPHEWRRVIRHIRGDDCVKRTPQKNFKVEFLAEQAALRERGEGSRGERREEGIRKIGNHWQKGRKWNKSNRRGHGDEGSRTVDGSTHDGMSLDSFRLPALSFSANPAVTTVSRRSEVSTDDSPRRREGTKSAKARKVDGFAVGLRLRRFVSFSPKGTFPCQTRPPAWVRP